MDSTPPRGAPGALHQRLVNEQKLTEIKRADQHAEEHQKDEGTLQDRTAFADFSSSWCGFMHDATLWVGREDTLVCVGDRRLVRAGETAEYRVDGVPADRHGYGDRH